MLTLNRFNCLWVVALLALLVPDLALAASTITQDGKAWDLYVFGNGYVIREVLNGIKILMTGEGTGFRTLLLFLATVGFLSLAIAAGFDPAKNLIRMFTYIIAVWMVSYGSTTLKADVVVNDPIDSKMVQVSTYDPLVEGVPALVALPAVVTSQVGIKFTQFVETYFGSVTAMGPAFTLSGGAGGQFNLYNRMVEETNQYRFTDENLKRTMSSYMANCVVPAMALGRISYDELLNTNDFTAMLANAKSPSLLMTFFPMKKDDLSWMSGEPTVAGLSPGSVTSAGVVLDCEAGYKQLYRYLEEEAAAMLGAKTAQWSKAGILVPYEEAVSVMLAGSSAPGSVRAGFSRPSGFILQQAMLNQSSESFRAAALQTGNSDLMQAAAIAQAEQNQKSTMVAGFQIFNNMMGYVYAVLQSFIFALTPIIILALVIPGIGKSMFVNYAQILIWLALWTPMLAIINFIITLFGSQSFSESVGSAGLTMKNKAIISERANDLVVAAQFLGTMVPLLTWGVVKGAMAFTEFISSGIGSQFASQAGATAANGNLSMNNMSMDNTSMNKFNTASSSAVGTQGIDAFANAGAMTVKQGLGGGSASHNDSNISASQQIQNAQQKALAMEKSVQANLQEMKNKQWSESQVLSEYASAGTNEAKKEAIARSVAMARSNNTGDKADMSKQVQDARRMLDSVTAGREAHAKVEGSWQAGGAIGKVAEFVGGGKLNFAAGGSINRQVTNNGSVEKGTTDGNTVGSSVGTGANNTLQNNTSAENSAGTSEEKGTRASKDFQQSMSRAVSDSLARSEAFKESLQHSQSVTSQVGFADNVDAYKARAYAEELESLRNSMASPAEISARMSAMNASLDARAAGTEGAFNSGGQMIAGRQGALAGAVQGPTGRPMAGATAEFNKSQDAARQQLAAHRAQVAQGAAGVNTNPDWIANNPNSRGPKIADRPPAALNFPSPR